MSPAHDSKLASTALALAATDPESGSIDLRKGWNAGVIEETGSSYPRRLHVTSPDGREIVLIRFAGPMERPDNYPESVPFVEAEIVWAGASLEGAAAIWISPRDPARVAATAVVQSVQSGWELDSSINAAFVGLKSVTLTQRRSRRGVSMVSDHVTLSDAILADRNGIGSV